MKSLKDLCCETIVKNIKFDNIDKLNVNEDCKHLIYIKFNEIYPEDNTCYFGLRIYQFVIIMSVIWFTIISIYPIIIFFIE